MIQINTTTNNNKPFARFLNSVRETAKMMGEELKQECREIAELPQQMPLHRRRKQNKKLSRAEQAEIFAREEVMLHEQLMIEQQIMEDLAKKEVEKQAVEEVVHQKRLRREQAEQQKQKEQDRLEKEKQFQRQQVVQRRLEQIRQRLGRSNKVDNSAGIAALRAAVVDVALPQKN